MLHMIVEQTYKYPMRMKYDPETKTFSPRNAGSLFYARNFTRPDGWIKESGTPRELCAKTGQWTVEYDSDDGKKKYGFFSDWNDAQSFASQVSEHDPTVRRTHLEDVFLEETGRDNMKVTEKRLKI